MLALFSRVGESSDIERNGTTLKSPTLNILKLESSETLTDFEGKPLSYIKQFNGTPLPHIKQFNGKPPLHIKQFNGKLLPYTKKFNPPHTKKFDDRPSINKLNETKVYRLVQIDHDSFLIVNE
jgi:hypothetical protein